MCVFARLLSKIVTRASGVNFRAFYTRKPNLAH
jgi:predicted phosphoadenosine phosphosulfate sulfurtransferase